MLNSKNKNSIAIQDAYRSNKRLELILIPTEKCNLRCSYCYEDFKLGQMPESIVQGIEKLILQKSPELETLRIQWFGGEPLLSMDIIRRVSRAALASKNHFNVDYSGSITTNGTLLSLSRATELFELGVTKAQISLDGDEDRHDTTRISLSGRDDFKSLWSNLCSISKSQTPIQLLLRLHVTSDNLASLKSLLYKLHQDINPNIYSIFFQKVGKWGGPNDSSLNYFLDQKEFFKVCDDLYKTCEELKLNYINNTKQKSIHVCYAAKPNSFAIRANGVISKCTVALSDPKNSIGKINSSGKIEFDYNKKAWWDAPLTIFDHKMLACPYSRSSSILE